jgi:hypothetical protein
LLYSRVETGTTGAASKFLLGTTAQNMLLTVLYNNYLHFLSDENCNTLYVL